MFIALNIIQGKLKKEIIVIKKDDKVINNTNEKIKEISEHFKRCFQTQNAKEIENIRPEKLKEPFNAEEIGKAVKSLKNNKSAGCDFIKAENIKYAPSCHQHIAKILNIVAETGKYPQELKTGLLTPLQKTNKPKGPPQNLRPVVLLSTLRKILAICIINRIRDKVCDKILPISQCAYLPGRSATELVFTFKTLAEKAITSCGYETNLLLLDMSKAFDTIERSTLIEDLKEILENDELHLIKILLKDVEYKVRLEGKIGESFTTNIGSPQGDGASALLFIIYLAISLKKYKETGNDNPLPDFLKDHTYQKIDNNNNFLTIDQQYADDIGWASTGQHIIENIEKEVPHALKKRNLKINPEKTEKYRITRNGDTEWEKCKYVGSLLGTNEDINRRTSLAHRAFNCIHSIFKNKTLNLKLKLRIFQALIESVFLYNSECWGLNKKQEERINITQRKFLRNILGIRWHKNNWISNEKLYEKTQQQEWSTKIAHRRLRFF